MFRNMHNNNEDDSGFAELTYNPFASKNNETNTELSIINYVNQDKTNSTTPTLNLKPSNSTNTQLTDDIDNERKSYIVRGLSGLRNIGNTCYMNATLQCLNACIPFSAYMVNNKFIEKLRINRLKY